MRRCSKFYSEVDREGFSQYNYEKILQSATRTLEGVLEELKEEWGVFVNPSFLKRIDSVYQLSDELWASDFFEHINEVKQIVRDIKYIIKVIESTPLEREFNLYNLEVFLRHMDILKKDGYYR